METSGFCAELELAYLVFVPYPSKLADKVMTTNTKGIPVKKKLSLSLMGLG